MTYVRQAARDIATAARGFIVVVTKSTVPVGTGDEVTRIIRETNPTVDFAVVSNPEFLREGAAIADFKRPDRIVIGLDDDRARSIMKEIYRPLYLNQAPVLFTDRRTAELTKYAANAFLAMKVTFINELADLCEAVGGDIQDIARGIGLDNRIGRKFLHAGPGYGGSCFPKDTVALAKTAQLNGRQLRLVEATIESNHRRKQAMAQRVIDICDGSVRGKRIAILGLTFKPNTDDVREAPAITIIEALIEAGAKIRAYDPQGMPAMASLINDIEMADTSYAAASEAEAVVIVTEWDEFRALDLDRLASAMARPVMVDLRNIYAQTDVAASGFRYFGIGRGHKRASQPEKPRG